MTEADLTTVPLSAPIETDSAGKAGRIAMAAVARILCPNQGTGGTGFLHKSGIVITAAHVVTACTPIVILPSSGGPLTGSVLAPTWTLI